jgi:flagellar assembly factor FliW
MHLESTRFGSIEIRDDAALGFPDGLIGLPSRAWALLAQDDGPFYWLHSLEDPDLALPVTNPWTFFPEYEVKISDEATRKLGLESPEHAAVLCVVRAGEFLSDFTVNLVGPIVLHSERRVGGQFINEVGGYNVRQPLFSEVELPDVQPATSAVPVAAVVA